MNQLERAIGKSMHRAFRTYEAIVDGWLMHAPEHFIQNFLLVDIGKRWCVYAEATRRKIAEGMGRLPRGRPPNGMTRRYDLLVWHGNDTPRAVIEIKRAMDVSVLRRDAERVKRSVRGGQRTRVGYLLVYSEIRTRHGDEGLMARFGHWESETGLKVAHADILGREDDPEDGWIAGFVLLRT